MLIRGLGPRVVGCEVSSCKVSRASKPHWNIAGLERDSFKGLCGPTETSNTFSRITPV